MENWGNDVTKMTHNSQNKNRKIDFSLDSAHSASFVNLTSSEKKKFWFTHHFDACKNEEINLFRLGSTNPKKNPSPCRFLFRWEAKPPTKISKKIDSFRFKIFFNRYKKRLFTTWGHAEMSSNFFPPQKWPLQKVIVNGAQCPESNRKND